MGVFSPSADDDDDQSIENLELWGGMKMSPINHSQHSPYSMWEGPLQEVLHSK